MADILCKQCGEPWDSYGITTADEGDMTKEEVKKFRAGKGCPSCEFATMCTHCRGTGLEPGASRLDALCLTCRDEHYVMAHKLERVDDSMFTSMLGVIYMGYSPRLRSLQSMPVTILTTSKWNKSLEGWYVSLKILCPDCCSRGEKWPVCTVCQGDRKFHKRELTEREFGERINSLLDASDEEPIGMIDDWLGG